MADYSVYEAKARFSEVLRLVKDHREVVITQHGKRIARIVPFEREDEGEETLDDRLARLADLGVLQRSSEKPKSLRPAPPGRRSKGALKRFLEDRG